MQTPKPHTRKVQIGLIAALLHQAPRILNAALPLCVCFSLALPAPGAEIKFGHRIDNLRADHSGNVSLTLHGALPVALQKYFDLFPLETSANLALWKPLATVVRTHVTNEIVYVDSAAGEAVRFYRTPTNHFSTPFLRPTGRFSVGKSSRMLTDSSRTNRFGVQTNSSFMATFWYPAEPAAAVAPAAYSDHLLAERKSFWGAYTNRIPHFISHAWPNAPLAATSNLFPIIIYSHGLGDVEGRGVRTENTAMAQELASHDYIVVSVDHTDTYATVLPPDQLIVGRNAWSFNFPDDRLKDVTFLLEYFTKLNAEDPLFKGRFDMDKIGMMGWSFGGGTAAETCRTDDRLKAAVLLDAYLASAPALLKNGVGKPFLSMNSGGLIADNTTLFNQAATNAYLLSIKGASHEAFTDNSWIIGPSAVTRQRALTMNACLVSFFNKHLKGIEDHLIENPGAVHPDVVSFRKK